MATSTALRPAFRGLLKSNRSQQFPPTFLLPSLVAPYQQTSPFSSTTSNLYPRDMNRERGVSTKRSTGMRQPVSVSKTPLPKPVLDPKKRSKVEVDPDHGLWHFFYSKDKPINTPEEDADHGRPWTVDELRGKSWEDLHALWWQCCKERNRISTNKFESERLEAGYGDFERTDRDVTVRRTQRAIKHVLTERYYAWRDAEVLAQSDPEIDLSGNGPVYNPSEEYFEDAPEEAEPVKAEQIADPAAKSEERATR